MATAFFVIGIAILAVTSGTILFVLLLTQCETGREKLLCVVFWAVLNGGPIFGLAVWAAKL